MFERFNVNLTFRALARKRSRPCLNYFALTLSVNTTVAFYHFVKRFYIDAIRFAFKRNVTFLEPTLFHARIPARIPTSKIDRNKLETVSKSHYNPLFQYIHINSKKRNSNFPRKCSKETLKSVTIPFSFSKKTCPKLSLKEKKNHLLLI